MSAAIESNIIARFACNANINEAKGGGLAEGKSGDAPLESFEETEVLLVVDSATEPGLFSSCATMNR